MLEPFPRAICLTPLSPHLAPADGVDIDYEPTSSGCTWSAAAVKCATDAEFIRVGRRGGEGESCRLALG